MLSIPSHAVRQINNNLPQKHSVTKKEFFYLEKRSFFSLGAIQVLRKKYIYIYERDHKRKLNQKANILYPGGI
jgi:hypothetical protein